MPLGLTDTTCTPSYSEVSCGTTGSQAMRPRIPQQRLVGTVSLPWVSKTGLKTPSLRISWTNCDSLKRVDHIQRESFGFSVSWEVGQKSSPVRKRALIHRVTCRSQKK